MSHRQLSRPRGRTISKVDGCVKESRCGGCGAGRRETRVWFVHQGGSALRKINPDSVMPASRHFFLSQGPEEVVSTLARCPAQASSVHPALWSRLVPPQPWWLVVKDGRLVSGPHGGAQVRKKGGGEEATRDPQVPRSRKSKCLDFSDGPVAETLSSRSRGHGFSPRSAN